jgi:hypothetical protein
MKTWHLALAAVGALALSLPAIAAPPGVPDDAFLKKAEELAQWIDDHSDFGPMPRHPAYVFLPQGTIQYMYFVGSGLEYTGREHNQIVAMYHDGWMILDETFDPEKNADVLLHELVHHMQFVEKREYRCLGEAERVAYDLEAQFSAETGIASVRLDPLMLMFITSCPQDWL